MDFLQEELDEILNIFQQEGSEILQSMDKNLLLLEKKPKNLDVAMHLFRDAHSLKGSARMLGFEDIQNIAHKIEDVLGLIRENKLQADSYITDTISSALNLIDLLIRKTVEQKTEFKSLETSLHIKKLDSICNGELLEDETKKISKEEEEIQLFKENFQKFEDCLTGIILIYTKTCQTADFEQLGDILNIISEFSLIIEKTSFKQLKNILLLISKCVATSIHEKNTDDETFLSINFKLNDLVEEFNKIAASCNLQTKNYYEEANNVLLNNKLSDSTIKKQNSEELKNVELLELINKAAERIHEINKNKHSLAEIKSLLNEIVSRLKNNDFKKIYETVLLIITDFEKEGSKLQTDTIEALSEILENTAGIVEARLSKNIYNDFVEEIELLNQKALIIQQITKYELKNPTSKIRSVNPPKSIDWAQSFDTTAIKTLRVNSDKLDKLVGQIGNLIITKIKSHEHAGMIKLIQDELLEWQKYYHKIGYYMKFYEKKYIQKLHSDKNEDPKQKKDGFLSYNRQLISFHNINQEKMNSVLQNLNFLMKEFQENNIKLSAATSEIEAMVKSMRILPLSTVFNLFPRMVHNIAKDKGKNIEFFIEGGDVSADKKIIEDIKIPIMHIIRNSIDHGIENPREREKAGKNKTGNITLKAAQKENKIVISIKDDGKGINIQKIKQKAIEKGFVTFEAAETMTKEQLANFIFYPGFSTGESVTELSGRGLGLDIVHTKISQLNGRIDVYSEENKGTIVTMELPTTMATLKTFILMENDQLFAIPTSSIETVLQISPKDIKNRENRYYFIHKNAAVPIVSLSSILGNSNENEENPSKLTVMVLKAESVTTGIIIQKLLGDEEILHKKLPEPMLRVKNISGITTLANGEMCLLLNVSDLLNSNKTNPNKLNSTKSLTFEDNSKYKILIVDDSITTRRLLCNVLMSGGYKADVQSGAIEALEVLETNKYDLIISDYEMPNMNGLEFIKTLRTKEKTKNTPVIIVTTAKQSGLKEEFSKLGVQEFIQKGYFEQQSFLKTVNKYLNLLKMTD